MNLILTGSLVPSGQQVGPHHRPDAQQAHTHRHIVERPVPRLQEEPGQDHQDWDDETVQELRG